jgi:hypothetical protein
MEAYMRWAKDFFMQLLLPSPNVNALERKTDQVVLDDSTSLPDIGKTNNLNGSTNMAETSNIALSAYQVQERKMSI